MGHTTERTFEENVELIASSLARLADQQAELLTIAGRNSDHICGKCHESQPDVPAEPETPKPLVQPGTVLAEAPANSAMDYEQLKFALIQRGVEIKKGTKMTTLLKLWEEHKFDPLKDGATTTTGVAESAAAAAEDAPPPEEDVPVDPKSPDLFDEPAPPPEPMTRAGAMAKITAAFAKGGEPTPDEANAVRAAFGEMGVKGFHDVPEDQLPKLVEIALRKLAELHQAEGSYK